MSFAEHAADMTDGEIAASLEYNAAYAKSDLARAVMQEAARRLCSDPPPHFVEPRPRDKPPLKAYAVPQ